MQRGSFLFNQAFIRFKHAQAATTLAEVAGTARAPLSDLLGRKHNYLRISLTEKCNLRCQYCMPAEGVRLSTRSNLLSRDEMLRLARAFATLGVDKVRLTGGEPTLRADLVDIIQGLKHIDGIRSVSMTTNGIVLTRRLPAYQRAGLSALNISLDSLQHDKYEKMARRPGLPRVLAGIDLALQLGYQPVKINTVLMKGFNDDELCDFVEYTKDREVEVRFIEFMPFTGNKWDDTKLIPYRKALATIMTRYPDLAPCPTRPNDTATVWQVPGYKGAVGFISSMTQHFCSSCNRLRLTADGNLKVCLFGNAEVSLRDAVRAGVSDDDLEALIRAALNKKKPKHAARALTAATTRLGPLVSRVPCGYSSRATIGAWGRLALRGFSTHVEDDDGAGGLTHLDSKGRARMVDISGKAITVRTAVAEGKLLIGAELVRVLRDSSLPKGDALTVAQVAGVMAAKRTSELIPLCHQLALECVRVELELPEDANAEERGGAVRVRCEVRTIGRTGAEMEALTGAALAALTLYDMCKAVDKGMCLTELRVVCKTGGRSDNPKKHQI